jgi:hypothetical protein
MLGQWKLLQTLAVGHCTAISGFNLTRGLQRKSLALFMVVLTSIASFFKTNKQQ